MQGVGRHPALGSEKMTSDELARKIVAEEPNAKTPRHDEVGCVCARAYKCAIIFRNKSMLLHTVMIPCVQSV